MSHHLRPLGPLSTMLRRTPTASTGNEPNPAIDRAQISVLKSDLVLLQSEIDGYTGEGGILQLQRFLSKMEWSPDPLATLQHLVSLQSLILEKLNELAVLGGTAVPSITPKQSKIGDLFTHFRTLSTQQNPLSDRRKGGEQMEESLQHNQQIYFSSPPEQQPPMGKKPPLSTSLHHRLSASSVGQQGAREEAPVGLLLEESPHPHENEIQNDEDQDRREKKTDQHHPPQPKRSNSIITREILLEHNKQQTMAFPDPDNEDITWAARQMMQQQQPGGGRITPVDSQDNMKFNANLVVEKKRASQDSSLCVEGGVSVSVAAYSGVGGGVERCSLEGGKGVEYNHEDSINDVEIAIDRRSSTSRSTHTTQPDFFNNNPTPHQAALQQQGGVPSPSRRSKEQLSLEECRQRIAFLEKKLRLFSYLEGYWFDTDPLEATHEVMVHPALTALGIPLEEILDDRSITRLPKGPFSKPAGKGASMDATMANLAASTMGGKRAKLSVVTSPNSTAEASDPLAMTQGTAGGLAATMSSSLPTGTVNALTPFDIEINTKLKAIVAFQNSILEIFLEKFQQMEGHKQQEMEGYQRTIHQLEHRIETITDNVKRERQKVFVRNESEKNVLLRELRVGSSEAGGGGGGGSTIMRPPTPLDAVNTEPQRELVLWRQTLVGSSRPGSQLTNSRPLSRMTAALDPRWNPVSAGGMSPSSRPSSRMTVPAVEATTTNATAMASSMNVNNGSTRPGTTESMMTPAGYHFGTTNPLPIVATSLADFESQQEKEYLRTIHQQSTIIKEMTTKYCDK